MTAKETFFERGLNSSIQCHRGEHGNCIMLGCSCACHRQNAAESLPARAKDSRCDCKAPRSYAGSDETICANCGGSHPFPAITLREVAEPKTTPSTSDHEAIDIAVLSTAFHNVLADFHHDDTTFQETKAQYLRAAIAENGLIEALLPHFEEIAGMETSEPQPDSGSIPDLECKFCPQLKSQHEPDGSCYNLLTSAKFESRDSSSISTAQMSREQELEWLNARWKSALVEGMEGYSNALIVAMQALKYSAKGQSNGR